MKEYDFLKKMLSDKYLAPNQSVMTEVDVQNVNITPIHKNPYILYRFETEGNEGILPFFDQTQNALRNLRSFCDYIILSENNAKLYVMLVELKSGDVRHAQSQLDASLCFVEYLLKTAERIKDANNFLDFDSHAIVIKMLVVKPIKTRRTTRIDGKSQLKDDGSHLTYISKDFDLSYILRFIKKH